MSGIYIHGMEMPTEDEEIIIRISPDGIVMTEYALPITGVKAVPVPEHGRLVDASVLMKNCMKEDTFLAEMLFRKLSNAPTIIPADKEGEG